MYRIAKRFKSLAEGELPLDDISEWKVNENDPVDHFLFQSENSFGRKDIIKMKGLKRNPFKSISIGSSIFASPWYHRGIIMALRRGDSALID